MAALLKQSIFIAFFLSLFFHISVWTGLSLIDEQAKSSIANHEIIEITLKAQNKDKLSKQIVSQPKKSINNEIPQDAAYLSRSNQTVAEETRAANHGEFRNTSGRKNQKASPPSPSQNQAKAPKATKNSTSEKNRQQPSFKTFSNGPGLIISKFSPRFLVKPVAFPKKGYTKKELASQTDDHLKDKKSSLETLLNTREFIYFSYYERIRSKLRQYWEPKIKEKIKKIFASGRTIASSHDRITKVIIILNKSGVLIKVQLVGKSGLTDLDDAAVEAFRSAAPFPNPPKGIIEQDGHIRIRWDFVLEA